MIGAARATSATSKYRRISGIGTSEVAEALSDNCDPPEKADEEPDQEQRDERPDELPEERAGARAQRIDGQQQRPCSGRVSPGQRSLLCHGCDSRGTTASRPGVTLPARRLPRQ